ncbi:hypothetical protein [Natronoarchaeum philippinense]|uniref:hypothetical protein n=1 Tax=Natronoarchaeum philippinense TaxID=558529 RepID=UPI001FEA9BA6|nr:hypothetical protein [Natronoarchaeum philippinense]
MTINTDDDADRWKWVCPQGHRTWEPTNYHFWCAECAKNWSHNEDLDPEFDELRNKKTGETVTRDEIVLMTPAGPYEHTGGSA